MTEFYYFLQGVDLLQIVLIFTVISNVVVSIDTLPYFYHYEVS